MISKSLVDDFIRQKALAVVGASREKRKFGNTLYRSLKFNGYHVVPVNPHAEEIDGDQCYSSLTELPEPVDGAVIITPRQWTESVVKDAAAIGIYRLWIQPGAETDEAIHFCRRHGIGVVFGECMLMYAEPVKSIHRVHRGLRRFIGKLPR